MACAVGSEFGAPEFWFELPLAITVDTVYNSAQHQICKAEDSPDLAGDGIPCSMPGSGAGAFWWL